LIEALLPIRRELALKVAAHCGSTEFSHSLDPKQPFGLDERGEVFNGSLHRIVALLARHILDRGTNRFGHRL
jgi:hypothetical protein